MTRMLPQATTAAAPASSLISYHLCRDFALESLPDGFDLKVFPRQVHAIPKDSHTAVLLLNHLGLSAATLSRLPKLLEFIRSEFAGVQLGRHALA